MRNTYHSLLAVDSLEKDPVPQSLRHRRDQLNQNISHHNLVTSSSDECIFMLAARPILPHKFLHLPVMIFPQLGYYQIIELEDLPALIFHKSVKKSVGELYFAQGRRLG